MPGIFNPRRDNMTALPSKGNAQAADLLWVTRASDAVPGGKMTVTQFVAGIASNFDAAGLAAAALAAANTYTDSGIASRVPLTRTLTINGTAFDLSADRSWTVSAPTGANPTASVGLAAVNGSASTFLRSDGAPALDVTIAPTWTGLHTFSKSAVVNMGATGTIGLVVNAIANASVNLAEFRDDGANPVFSVKTNGDLICGKTSGAPRLEFSPSNNGSMEFRRTNGAGVLFFDWAFTDAEDFRWRFYSDRDNDIFDFRGNNYKFSSQVGFSTIPLGTARCSVSTAASDRLGLVVCASASQTAVIQQLQGISSTSTVREQVDIDSTWATSTDASRKARGIFRVWDTAARECMRMEASGTAAMIGFLGANAVVKQTALGTTTGFTANASANAVFNESTFTGGSGASAYTISDMVLAMKNYGLLTA